MTFEIQPGRCRIDQERDPWGFVVDPILIVCVGLITALGAVLVFSATRGPATELIPADTSFLEKQTFFAIAGAALGVVAAIINIDRIRSLVSIGYIGLIVLLIGIDLFGANINGAQAWFRFGGFTFQPSEPGKLVLIIALATIFSTGEVGFQRVMVGLALAGLPILMILTQPDLGTALVYIVITAVMIMMSHVSMRLIIFLVLTSAIAITLIFASDVLEDYQKDRLTVFVLDEEAVARLGSDAIRVAYNAEQSQIAIGNGGLTGTGLFEGSQTSSNLVPEQQTDFIFSVAGEELGFRGAATLLGLFALVILRMWRVAVRATDEFDRLLAIGVMAMFVFQVFQSAGMTMGMMPVTGIPMPLVSYGGSSMLTSMIAVGLVLGVHRRRYDYVRQ